MNQRPAPTTFRRATQEAGPNGLTPAGLQLTHAPLADCHRYDQLRKAS